VKLREPAPTHDDFCVCEGCVLTAQLARYIFLYMEPTDRCLRPPGNTCQVSVAAS
jgi:hypothetical protein